MEANQLLKIPELVRLIAQHLDQHDLTICLRISHAWFEAFCPLLYETIAVFDFDIYVLNVGYGYARPSSAKNGHARFKGDKPSGYGGSRIYKYGHLVRSIVVREFRSLEYLGDQAVNLSHVHIRRNPEGHSFRPSFCDGWEQLAWNKHWEKFAGRERIVDTWVALIDRNPGLKSVGIDLFGVDPGTEEIIHALAKREELTEIHLMRITQANTVEMLLDHCPHVPSIRLTNGLMGDETPKQIFSADSSGQAGPATRIRHLDFYEKDSCHKNQTWINHVLRRCPELETLVLPACDDAVFSEIAQEIIKLSSSKFFGLRRLELYLCWRDMSETHRALIAALLNSCAESLTSLAITDYPNVLVEIIDYPNVLVEIIDLIDTGLWERLQEFRYTGYQTTTLDAPVPRLCAPLALCPNLRVFEVSNVMVTANEFLQTRLACLQTLVSFKLIVCCDHSDIPGVVHQPFPELFMPAVTEAEAQMATMAQFEIAMTVPVIESVIAGEIAQGNLIYERILELVQLVQLDFGTSRPTGDRRFVIYPALISDCAPRFRKGLPRLQSLFVKGIPMKT
ncbi:hypothetical protein BGX33_009309 [Mortierella sp. NVP41]|nr:hypothetical protein BGX33_009309 [Mortierella sp. NVP41]